MTPRLSGHFSIFGLVFFVLKSLPGIARQWSPEKFAGPRMLGVVGSEVQTDATTPNNVGTGTQQHATGYAKGRNI